MKNFDVAAWFADAGDQFRNLNTKDPGTWPLLPRLAAFLGIFAVVQAAGYALYWQGQLAELDDGKAREMELRSQYEEKIAKAVNLEVLKRQKEQVGQYVNTLEKQLPSKSEMDALLSEINQAGIGRGLQFELFKPQQVAVKDYYAELPIEIKVIGSYHAIGGFASDVANLSRIVTLNDLHVTVPKDNSALVLNATAKTFRYLDPEEVAAQRREQAKKKEGKS